MERSEIFVGIIKVLTDHNLISKKGLVPSKVKERHRFKEDLGFDSLDVIDFVMYTEDFFQIELTDEEIGEWDGKEGIATIKDTLDLLEKKLPEKTNSKL